MVKQTQLYKIIYYRSDSLMEKRSIWAHFSDRSQIDLRSVHGKPVKEYRV